MIFQRSEGDKATPRQREAIKLQVQGWIMQPATRIPNPTNSVQFFAGNSNIFSGAAGTWPFHGGPFASTGDLLDAHKDDPRERFRDEFRVMGGKASQWSLIWIWTSLISSSTRMWTPQLG